MSHVQDDGLVQLTKHKDGKHTILSLFDDIYRRAVSDHGPRERHLDMWEDTSVGGFGKSRVGEGAIIIHYFYSTTELLKRRPLASAAMRRDALHELEKSVWPSSHTCVCVCVCVCVLL